MRVNINKLRSEFDKNPKISMIDGEIISNDAHAVACVLKQYFRELPTPLLTFHMYERFIELFKQSNTTVSIDDNDNTEAKQVQDVVRKTTNPEQQDIMEHDNETRQTTMDDPDDRTMAESISTKATFTPNKSPSPTPMVTKSKSTTQHSKSSAVISEGASGKTKQQSQFTTSASDSQLISLSSVVTTTTSDIKYQVKLDDLKRLLLQLPKAHYQTLKFLMRHLACIAANGRKTGMDSKNVAIVWAPNLLKPRELELSAGLETLQIIGLQAVITEQLIKHHKFLFDDDLEDDVGCNQQQKFEEDIVEERLCEIDNLAGEAKVTLDESKEVQVEVESKEPDQAPIEEKKD